MTRKRTWIDKNNMRHHFVSFHDRPVIAAVQCNDGSTLTSDRIDWIAATAIMHRSIGFWRIKR